MDEPLGKEEGDQACSSIADDGSLVVRFFKLQHTRCEDAVKIHSGCIPRNQYIASARDIEEELWTIAAEPVSGLFYIMFYDHLVSKRCEDAVEVLSLCGGLSDNL